MKRNKIFFFIAVELVLLIISSSFITPSNNEIASNDDSLINNFIEWIKSLFKNPIINTINQTTVYENSSINLQNVNISFIGISEGDKVIWLNHLGNVHDYWFYGVKNIGVYGNKNVFNGNALRIGCSPIMYFGSGDSLGGCNDNKGNIVYYSQIEFWDDEQMDTLLCHELAHTQVSGMPLSIEEKIVKDIANKGSCF